MGYGQGSIGANVISIGPCCLRSPTDEPVTRSFLLSVRDPRSTASETTQPNIARPVLFISLCSLKLNPARPVSVCYRSPCDRGGQFRAPIWLLNRHSFRPEQETSQAITDHKTCGAMRSLGICSTAALFRSLTGADVADHQIGTATPRGARRGGAVDFRREDNMAECSSVSASSGPFLRSPSTISTHKDFLEARCARPGMDARLMICSAAFRTPFPSNFRHPLSTCRHHSSRPPS